MIVKFIKLILFSAAVFPVAWYASDSVWINVLVLVGAILIYCAFLFWEELWGQSEDQDGSDKDKKSVLIRFASYAGKWAVLGIVFVALFVAAGWVIIEFEALDRKKARVQNLVTWSKKLKKVYELENGEYIPDEEINNYSKENWIAPIVPPYDGSYPAWAEDLYLWPEDEITIKATLVGDAWRTNCKDDFSPLGRFTTHTPGGTRHGGVNYIVFFDEGKARIDVEEHGGAKLEFNVGCPTETGWLKLDYKVTEFFINNEKKI